MAYVKLWLLYIGAWGHLIVCTSRSKAKSKKNKNKNKKQTSLGSFKSAIYKSSKVGDRSRGRPEGSLFQ